LAAVVDIEEAEAGVEVDLAVEAGVEVSVDSGAGVQVVVVPAVAGSQRGHK
jgi:hypothetical protein